MDSLSELKFRPCIPSDVDAAVPLIYSSGPTTFDYVFNNGKITAIDFLKFAFLTKGGEFSYDNHIAAIHDDRLIGVGTAFTSKKASSFTLHDSRKILKFYKLGAFKIMGRGLRVEQLIKLPKKKEIAIAHLGIDEKSRSKGYGQALIEYLMANAEIETNGCFVLDVSLLNPRAQTLYDRLGFEVTKLSESNLKQEYGFVANHNRMEKNITP